MSPTNILVNKKININQTTIDNKVFKLTTENNQAFINFEDVLACTQNLRKYNGRYNMIEFSD